MKPDNLAAVLMLRILEIVKESGADRTDALCALQASEAMLPQLQLDVKPMAVFSSFSERPSP